MEKMDSCLHSNVQYSIIINGRPCSRIKYSKGIHQGDPISLFLFVIAIDYLSRLLHKPIQKNLIKGVSFSNDYTLTHLFFDDDILLFMEDNENYIANLHFAIRAFEAVIALKMYNFSLVSLASTFRVVRRENHF